MPRLFVALELPEVLKQAICGLQAGLGDARWLEADALHLTLAFVGEVDPSAQRRIEEAARLGGGAPARRRAARNRALSAPGASPRALDGGFSGGGARNARRLRPAHPRPSGFPPRFGASSPRTSPSPGSAARRRLPRCTITSARIPLFRSPPAPIASFRLLSSVLRPSGAPATRWRPIFPWPRPAGDRRVGGALPWMHSPIHYVMLVFLLAGGVKGVVGLGASDGRHRAPFGRLRNRGGAAPAGHPVVRHQRVAGCGRRPRAGPVPALRRRPRDHPRHDVDRLPLRLHRGAGGDGARARRRPHPLRGGRAGPGAFRGAGGGGAVHDPDPRCRERSRHRSDRDLRGAVGDCISRQWASTATSSCR